MSYLTFGGNINQQLRVPTSAYYGQPLSNNGGGGITGPTGAASTVPGPTGPGGGTGTGGGDVFDYALVRNIGMHAYINDASISYSFNNINNILTYTIVVHGNGVYYDMNFSYSPTLDMSGYTYSNANTANFNNSSTSGQPNLTLTIPFTVVTPVSGYYVVTISIDTHNTGGLGNGSYVTKTILIYLEPSDPMGPPNIVAPYTILGVIEPSTIVSGIKYFTNGSYVPVPKDGLSVNNMYNIVDNRVFTYNTFSGSSYGSYAASTLEYLVSPGVYAPFPRVGANVNYFNSAAFNMYVTSAGQIRANLTNAIGKTTSNILYFPSPNTWIGTQTAIGYLYPVPDEVTIPQAAGTSSAVKTLIRCTIPSSEASPETPTLSNVVVNSPGQLTTLSTRDPAYYPYDGYFRANDFTTSLFYTYILPSSPGTFTPGTKYLLIKITTQGYLNTFVLNFGPSSSGIVNTWGLWNSSSTPTTWYDWSIPSNSPGGCGGGSSGTSITLQLNTSATYTVVGDIYVNIKFTGYIRQSELYISN
jgi:hypothetical protein